MGYSITYPGGCCCGNPPPPPPGPPSCVPMNCVGCNSTSLCNGENVSYAMNLNWSGVSSYDPWQCGIDCDINNQGTFAFTTLRGGSFCGWVGGLTQECNDPFHGGTNMYLFYNGGTLNGLSQCVPGFGYPDGSLPYGQWILAFNDGAPGQTPYATWSIYWAIPDNEWSCTGCNTFFPSDFKGIAPLYNGAGNAFPRCDWSKATITACPLIDCPNSSSSSGSSGSSGSGSGVSGSVSVSSSGSSGSGAGSGSVSVSSSGSSGSVAGCTLIGCGCCPMTGAPSIWIVTIPVLTNSGCSDCTNLAGTYYCHFLDDGGTILNTCTWQSASTVTLCGAPNYIQVLCDHTHSPHVWYVNVGAMSWASNATNPPASFDCEFGGSLPENGPLSACTNVGNVTVLSNCV